MQTGQICEGLLFYKGIPGPLGGAGQPGEIGDPVKHQCNHICCYIVLMLSFLEGPVGVPGDQGLLGLSGPFVCYTIALMKKVIVVNHLLL